MSDQLDPGVEEEENVKEGDGEEKSGSESTSHHHGT